MRCPACQASPPEGSRFCPSCGKALTNVEDETVLSDAVETMAVGALAAGTPLSGRHAVSGVQRSADTHGAAEPFEPGTLLGGRFRIVRQLGRGGMGVVYQADDLRLGHPVALKFLPPALAADPRRLAQFHNEVRLARQVSHPNVCRVYDIGDVDGQMFLSMEYIDGEDLAAALRRRGRFPEDEAVELIRQICAGLAAVHGRGVLHRDLKPANIMINRAGGAQLMDFGIAAAGQVKEADRISEGTPAYMAPEQLAREEVSVRSDIYALGLVMYEVLTGLRLFNAKTLEELTGQQASAASAVPADLAALARPRLQQAVHACLRRDPAQRPDSVQAVAAMLQTVLLDATSHWRRTVQTVAQGGALAMIAIGLLMLRKPTPTASAIAFVLIAAGAVLAFVELRYPLGWTVGYKGHQIRFTNHPFFGERLFIDGALVDRGRIGMNVTLRGTIEKGAGAGERITAEIKCAFLTLSCRMVAESFTRET
jgi:hypothetical protein